MAVPRGLLAVPGLYRLYIAGVAGLQPVRGAAGAVAFAVRRNMDSLSSYAHPDRDHGGDGVGEDLGGGLGGDVLGGVGAGRLGGRPDGFGCVRRTGRSG